MITNCVYVPTRGKDPKKFVVLEGFADHCPTERQKCIVNHIPLTGKIGQFIQSKAIYSFTQGYNFNGYGWADHECYFLLSVSDGHTLLKMIEKKKEADSKKRKLTDDDKIEAWARRLVRLVPEDITLDDAIRLAEEKLDYQERQIDELYKRQGYRHSSRREKLINKLERENPLRYIKDYNHAKNILSAHNRHMHSNYELKLEEARNLAGWGHIGYDEVRDYALRNAEYTDDNESI